MKVFVVYGFSYHSIRGDEMEVVGVFRNMEGAKTCLDKKFLEISERTSEASSIDVYKDTVEFRIENSEFEYHYAVERKNMEEQENEIK